MNFFVGRTGIYKVQMVTEKYKPGGPFPVFDDDGWVDRTQTRQVERSAQINLFKEEEIRDIPSDVLREGLEKLELDLSRGACKEELQRRGDLPPDPKPEKRPIKGVYYKDGRVEINRSTRTLQLPPGETEEFSIWDLRAILKRDDELLFLNKDGVLWPGEAKRILQG